MTGASPSTEVLLTRMEGKIDLLTSKLEHYDKDMVLMRTRFHDLSNQITPVVMLDLPGRIAAADKTRAEHDARITALESVELQRKGAAKLASIMWAILGAAGTGTIAVLLRIMGGV